MTSALQITLRSLLTLLACLHSFANAAERPNILLILPDQMRASAMGCDGNAEIKTPNIDRLAAEGIRFQRTYANVPVCCPARAILMTGTYPHVNGMIANDLRLREKQVTIAEILAQAGYRTGFVGKWHLDGGPRNPGFVPPGPRRQGFDFWAAYECHHTHFAPTYFRDTPEVITARKFEPEASCDFAIEFLKSQPQDQPFFLTVQMGPPHDPYGAPKNTCSNIFRNESRRRRTGGRVVKRDLPRRARKGSARHSIALCRSADWKRSPPITLRLPRSTIRSVN